MTISTLNLELHSSWFSCPSINHSYRKAIDKGWLMEMLVGVDGSSSRRLIDNNDWETIVKNRSTKIIVKWYSKDCQYRLLKVVVEFGWQRCEENDMRKSTVSGRQKTFAIKTFFKSWSVMMVKGRLTIVEKTVKESWSSTVDKNSCQKNSYQNFFVNG